MNNMTRYTIDRFIEKYAGRRHISAGVHFKDGNIISFMNNSFSQIMEYISSKDIDYIVTK